MSAHEAASPPTRRLAGCLTYLVAGALLLVSTERGLDWWDQVQALRSGASNVVRSEFDDLGNQIGEFRIPADETAARSALLAAILLGAGGIIALVAGVILQGVPWRALQPVHGADDSEVAGSAPGAGGPAP